jgi:hypothetical protein
MQLAFLAERLAEAQMILRLGIISRLAALLREMLTFEVLRETVRSFFDVLFALRSHENLLHLMLDLARRLRFAPDFETLVWMRRLLDEGTESVRVQTSARLLDLALESGPRVVGYLRSIHGWFPGQDREVGRWSPSNRIAVAFLFELTVRFARLTPREKYGAWPCPSPVLGALEETSERAEETRTMLVDWLLQPQFGVTREPASELVDLADDSLESPVDRVAAVLIHWALLLEGETASTENAKGKRILAEVLRELHSRADRHVRLDLLRALRRAKQAAEMAAVEVPAGEARQVWILWKRKVLELTVRWSEASASH